MATGLSRRFRWAIAAAGLLGTGILGWRLLSPAPRPNVLLITLDTTRADRLGCYGLLDAHTPHLDALAKRGTLFERVFAPAPLTLPSHASMLTGLYPPEHGVRANGEHALPPDVPTLAKTLKQSGYGTGAFVAAFVLDRRFGLDDGFDVYDDDLSQVADDGVGTHAYRPGEQVVNSALRWLQAPRREPYFCWVHLFDPHYPYLDHADRYGEAYRQRPYDAEIRYVDEQVGRLLKHLEVSGAADRTIVLVAGDHGEALGEHHERSHSMQLYNSTLHVPWIIAVPQPPHAGVRIRTSVSLVDMLPTVLDLAGCPAPAGLSGRSLRSAVSGKEPAAVPIYAETDEPYRAGHWSGLRAIVDGPWKYILTPRDELYDLSSDFGETDNRVAEETEIKQTLRQSLSDWEARMVRRGGSRVPLSESDRQRLSSLGYVSGGTTVSAGDAELVDVKDRMDLYHRLEDAETLVEMGRFADAVQPLRSILAEDESYFRAHSYLGLCLLQLQQPAEAIRHLQRSLELEPEAARVQATLGAALLMDRQYAAAAEALQAALRLGEPSYQAHYNLGRALEGLGRQDEALEQYRACLDLAPEYLPARHRWEALGK